MTRWIEDNDWHTIVEHVPIPSVDLVVRHSGGVVLGRRSNEPAKGSWFLPGGRIQKGERIEEVVHRVADEEVGLKVTIQQQTGVHDHFYDVHDVDGVATKQYVSHGFLVEAAAGSLPVAADDQHDQVRVFHDRPENCHEYVAAHLDAAGVL